MLKKIAKRVIAGSGLYKILKHRYIFLFHDISEMSDIQFSEEYSMSPNSFYKAIETIQRDFDVLSLKEVLSADTIIEKRSVAAIMFDDGFYSVYTQAYPFLKDKNIPFTISVNEKAVCENKLWFSDIVINRKTSGRQVPRIESYLEKIKDMEIWQIFNQFGMDIICELNSNGQNENRQEKIFCDKDDLISMLSSGLVSINSHTKSHYMLSRCNDEELATEIIDNKEFVESITGEPDRFFSIPFGNAFAYDSRAINICRQLGYEYIFTTTPNYFNVKNLTHKPAIIPRIGINSKSESVLKFDINMSLIKKRK